MAEARAKVEAAYAVAQNRPRDRERVRERILEACKDIELALIHEWEREVGGGAKDPKTGKWVPNVARGPSIHLLRVCLSNWGNLFVDYGRVTNEGPEFRTLQMAVTDLETNTTHTYEAVVSKYVERKPDRDGNPPERKVISTRKTSKGGTVYVCAATPDEARIMTRREAALGIRSLAEQVVGRPTLNAAMAQCRLTLREVPPAEWATRCVGTFSRLGITQEQVELVIGKRLEHASVEEHRRLAAVATAITDSQLTWEEFLQQDLEEKEERRRHQDPPKAVDAAPVTVTVPADRQEDSAPAAQSSEKSAGKPKRNLFGEAQ